MAMALRNHFIYDQSSASTDPCEIVKPHIIFFQTLVLPLPSPLATWTIEMKEEKNIQRCGLHPIETLDYILVFVPFPCHLLSSVF